MSPRRTDVGRYLFLAVAAIVLLTLLYPSFVASQVASAPGDDPELVSLIRAYQFIKNSYVKEIEPQELLRGAIQGMLEAAGDKQGAYFDPDEYRRFGESFQNSFEGIGAVLGEKDGRVYVVQTLPGFPAEASGLRAGDIILAVDGTDTTGMPVDVVASMIRGPAGTRVTLKLLRANRDEPVVLQMTRAVVTLYPVKGRMLDSRTGTGYIKIEMFRSQTAERFEEVLASLEKSGVRGLILDLRGNPGGLLSEALDVSSRLVPLGPVLQVQGRPGKAQVYYGSGPGITYPIVVLVDGNSASAAEILAGALRDRLKAPLVGSRTFGKGSIQTVIDLPKGGLKVTTASYLTPGGSVIEGTGLLPDVEVEFSQPGEPWPSPLDVTVTLRRGMHGQEVRELEIRLKALGLFSAEADTDYDSRTAQAVSALQALWGLDRTGEVDPETTRALNLHLKELQTRMGRDPVLDKGIQILKTLLH